MEADGQPDLFKPEPTRRIPYRGHAPYQAHSDTSKAAAVEIEPTRGTLQYDILEYVKKMKRYGTTADQIEAKCGISLNTVRPRLRELEEMGFIVKTTDTRPTRSGRQARTYVAYSYR